MPNDIHGEVTAVSPGYGRSVCVHCGARIHEDDNGAELFIWCHSETGSTVCYDDPPGSIQFGTVAEPEEDLVTCGSCGRTWNDAIITGSTPAPAGRCPFEGIHGDGDDRCDYCGLTLGACDFNGARHVPARSEAVSGHYMSPQARRRLANAIHGQEVIDLADDILDAIALLERPFGPAGRTAITRLIKGGADAYIPDIIHETKGDKSL